MKSQLSTEDRIAAWDDYVAILRAEGRCADAEGGRVGFAYCVDWAHVPHSTHHDGDRRWH